MAYVFTQVALWPGRPAASLTGARAAAEPAPSTPALPHTRTPGLPAGKQTCLGTRRDGPTTVRDAEHIFNE